MCDKCKGCIHRRALAGKSAAVCQYAIDTGKLRGCEPEDCPHWSGDQKELKRLMHASEERDFFAAFSDFGEAKGSQWYD